MILQYMLKWDIDPLMFHQPNTGTYDTVHSTLGDLIDATLAKYNGMYSLPVVNLSEHEIGQRMAARMAQNNSGVRAQLVPCTSLTISASQPATITLTGVAFGANTKTYSGQSISYVQLGAGQSVTLPAPACN